MTVNVFTPHRLRRLFASDALNVTRDPTLLFAISLSIVPAIAGFLFRDAIDSAMADAFGLTGFFNLVLPIFISLPAFMIGWVTGFLFLEDRDDGPLLALDVTPVGKAGFMSYRIAVTAVITIAITLLGSALLLPERGIAMALALSLMVAMEAVGVALVLPALASNKVEGLAVTKLINILSFAPLLALIPGTWRYVFGFVPTFWLGEVILNAGNAPSGGFVINAFVGIATHAIAIYLLYLLQSRRTG